MALFVKELSQRTGAKSKSVLLKRRQFEGRLYWRLLAGDLSASPKRPNPRDPQAVRCQQWRRGLYCLQWRRDDRDEAMDAEIDFDRP
jgi:hypothetical protein